MKLSKIAFVKDLNHSTICGLAIVMMIVFLSIMVPLFSPYNPLVGVSEPLSAPSLSNFLELISWAEMCSRGPLLQEG